MRRLRLARRRVAWNLAATPWKSPGAFAPQHGRLQGLHDLRGRVVGVQFVHRPHAPVQPIPGEVPRFQKSGRLDPVRRGFLSAPFGSRSGAAIRASGAPGRLRRVPAGER